MSTFFVYPQCYTDNIRNISTEKRHKSGKKRIQKQTSDFGKCPLFFLSQWAVCAKSGNRTQKKADNHFCAAFCAAFRMSTFFVQYIFTVIYLKGDSHFPQQVNFEKIELQI
jgi:hypothetical protein